MPERDANKSNTPAEAGQKEILVGFRVPERFHRRIKSECLRRDLTLKELVTDALKLFFKTPRDWDYLSVQAVTHGENGEQVTDEEVERYNAAFELWVKYVSSMPVEKVEVITKAISWDLLARKSARSKAVKGNVKPPKPRA